MTRGTAVEAAGAAMDSHEQAAVDRALMTTRAVRRHLDLSRPVSREVITECLEIAVHAPTASNGQTWRWVVVTDGDLKAGIAEMYRLSWNHYRSLMSGGGRRRFAGTSTTADRAALTQRSAEHLADHLHEVPVLVIPCVQGRVPDAAATDDRWRRREQTFRDTGRTHPRGDLPSPESVGLVELAGFFGSIYPAVWSFQLALRARGLGSSLTSMHLPFARQVAELLGIPAGVTQTCLVPVAYLTRPASVAPRVPAHELTTWNGWTIERMRRR